MKKCTECGEPATRKYEGEDVCLCCWIARDNTDSAQEDLTFDQALLFACDEQTRQESARRLK